MLTAKSENQDNSDRILKYLEGGMSESERITFENEMQSDSDLQKQVEDLRKQRKIEGEQYRKHSEKIKLIEKYLNKELSDSERIVFENEMREDEELQRQVKRLHEKKIRGETFKNREILERIEDYLNHEMPDGDRSLFENEFQNDATLQKKVEFMKVLPKAVQIHSENEIRKQLREIEAKLPRINPKSHSRLTRVWYGIAALILLLGAFLFLFRHKIFKNKIQQNQIENQNTKNEIQYTNGHEAEIKFVSVPVARIADSKFGFVKEEKKEKINVVIINESQIKQSAEKYLFKFEHDTLFIRTIERILEAKIYEFEIAAQEATAIDSTGQFIAYEKPALNGTYLALNSNYYRVDFGLFYHSNKVEFMALDSCKVTERNELELIKFYTSNE